MSQPTELTAEPPGGGREILDSLEAFLRTYYREEIGTLAQRYPSEQQSLEVAYGDLFSADRSIAEDYLENPEQIQEYLDEALRLYDLPVDVDLGRAHVRVVDLPEERTFYPGQFSPTDRAGEYVAIQGEISKASDEFSKIVEAAFECDRCGTMSYIPQTDGGFQEPHECQGCERQGPFSVDPDQSELIDAQMLRIQTPPEVAEGAGQELDVNVERDLSEVATVGDRVTISGVLHLEQVTKGQQKTGRFEPYLDGSGIEIEESDHTQIEITPDERSRIESLAAGAEGEPIDVAGESLAPKIHGLDQLKRMAILLMVGGQRVEHPDGSVDRGDFHLLILGDPGVAKSVLLSRVEEIAPRAVAVSGKGATVAGVTASAVQDDFGDGEAALKAGAFVKANQGVVAVDEIDDMPPEVRAAMLDPMSKQRISVNKWGINTTLATEASVIAAGNPKHGRFDPYEPMEEQYDLEKNLLSRFDLIYTPTDKPDPDRDPEVAEHILSSREAAKQWMRGEDLTDAAAETVEPTVAPDLLTKWVALAKRQPAPTMPADVMADLRESFDSLRGANGYDGDDPVPVTWRHLQGVVRIAEAAARFELSETIEERHAEIAMEAVGQSLRDAGQDEDGQFDADVVETGASKKSTDTVKTVERVLEEEFAYEEVPREDVVDEVQEQYDDISEKNVHSAIEKICRKHGRGIEPTRGKTVKWIGGQ
ncbi:MAG: minichromosome maintenance protein MCM [Halolamina sp.]